MFYQSPEAPPPPESPPPNPPTPPPPPPPPPNPPPPPQPPRPPPNRLPRIIPIRKPPPPPRPPRLSKDNRITTTMAMATNGIDVRLEDAGRCGRGEESSETPLAWAIRDPISPTAANRACPYAPCRKSGRASLRTPPSKPSGRIGSNPYPTSRRSL